MPNAAELIDTHYVVCDPCKEGKCISDPPPGDLHNWIDLHNKCSGMLRYGVVGRDFLSEYLRNGYIDVDREGLEPLISSGGGEPRKDGVQPPDSLVPRGATGALEIQRAMRRGVHNGVTVAEPPAAIPGWQRERTLRELQTTLPWSNSYSQDFKMNPQPHKDFAHAMLHITKAAGQLCGIIDELDHTGESAQVERVQILLADLVICALRGANTFPKGTIDLQNAVINRIKTKE